MVVDRDDVGFGAYRAIDIVRAARPLPDLVDAFRNGTAPPPLPGEPEVDYVPTQVFTEHLRYAFPGRSPERLGVQQRTGPRPQLRIVLWAGIGYRTRQSA